ncbi:hypothetical protein JXA84_03910 [candidate division WOR-3 bacterium]|nr:hypothetical protein [candidate division WOR-3 bacterium]
MKIIVFSILSLQLLLPVILMFTPFTANVKGDVELTGKYKFPHGTEAQKEYTLEQSNDFVTVIQKTQITYEVVVFGMLALLFLNETFF